MIKTWKRGTSRSLEVAHRMNCMAKKEAFFTLKDHKENFGSNLPFRLINPAKSEMGKISKRILDDILTNVKQKTSVNLWKNTAAVTNWFSRINRKQDSFALIMSIFTRRSPRTFSTEHSISPASTKRSPAWTRKLSSTHGNQCCLARKRNG